MLSKGEGNICYTVNGRCHHIPGLAPAISSFVGLSSEAHEFGYHKEQEGINASAHKRCESENLLTAPKWGKTCRVLFPFVHYK